MNFIHGMYRTPSHGSWRAMMRRCYGDATNGKYYKGAGIEVAPEWHNFLAFYADMGDRPEGMSIDRIDRAGNYCKANCWWATTREQGRNKSNNHLLSYRGTTQCLSAWAEQLGVGTDAIYRRIKKGWPIESVLRDKTDRKHINGRKPKGIAA